MATSDKPKRKWRLSFLNKKTSKVIATEQETNETVCPLNHVSSSEEPTKPTKISNWTMIKNLRMAIKAPDMEENLPGLAPVMTILLKNPHLLIRLLGHPTIQRLMNNPEAIRKVLTQLPVTDILRDPTSFDSRLKEIDVLINEMDKTGDSRSSSDGEREAPVSVSSLFQNNDDVISYSPAQLDYIYLSELRSLSHHSELEKTNNQIILTIENVSSTSSHIKGLKDGIKSLLSNLQDFRISSENSSYDTVPFTKLDWRNEKSEEQGKMLQVYKFVLTFYPLLVDRETALHVLHLVFQSSNGAFKNLRKDSIRESQNSKISDTDNIVEGDEEIFWRQYLKGIIPLPIRPLNPYSSHFPPTKESSLRQSISVSSSIQSKLEQIANANGCSVRRVVEAIWCYLLSKYSMNERDIVIGVSVRKSTNSLNCSCGSRFQIGNFERILPARIQVDFDSTFKNFLAHVNSQINQVEGRCSLLSEIHQWSEVPGDLLMFETACVYQQTSSMQQSYAKITDTSFNCSFNYPIVLSIYWEDKQLKLELVHEPSKLSSTNAQKIVGNLEAIFESISSKGEEKLFTINTLSQNEIKQMLGSWNNTKTLYPRDKCLHHLFEERVKAKPDSKAITFGNQSFTYSEINKKSNQLARKLQEMGIKLGSKVGIFMERSEDIVVAMIAVMKSSGCYIPLDIELPRDRLKFIVNDANMDVLITRSTVEVPEQLSATLLQLDQTKDEIYSEKYSDENLNLPEDNADNMLYILYTSGSTGNPKGVQIFHRGAVNSLMGIVDKNILPFMIVAMQTKPGITSDDIILAVTTITFDIAQLECLLPLITGAQAYIMPSNTAADMAKIKEALSVSGATILQATPATWRLLLASGDKKLKLLCGGEPMTKELAKELVSKCESLWNMYGPTETTVWCCVKKVVAEDYEHFEAMPVGPPGQNYYFLLLDNRFQPVPMGAVGELFIGGDCVAFGYLNRPELNSEKFLDTIPGKWFEGYAASSQLGCRWYRTGDLLRWLDNCSLEFIGRTDFQVKIRGYRIELGEIESVLNEHNAVGQCVVLAREDTKGDKRLVAYIRPKDVTKDLPSHEELRKFASAKLPKYMIPMAFIKIVEWKLNSNGKIDRKSLPAPEKHMIIEDTSSKMPFAHPRDAYEKSIKTIFEHVLQTGPIGIFDSFFELGGHSVLGIQVAGTLESLYKVEVPYSAILHSPTVEKLAKVVKKLVVEKGIEVSPIVDIQTKGQKIPFFCVNPALKSTLVYGALSYFVGEDQPFYGLEPRKPYDSIEAIAKDYMKWVHTKQEKGPYQIGGWSFGSTVAFELARQLSESGEEVYLYILDGRAPIFSKEYLTTDVDALELAVLFRGFKHYFGTGALKVSYSDMVKIQEDQRILHVMDLMDDSVLPENLPLEVAIGLFSRFRLDFNESEVLSRKYSPSTKFNGHVTIFKAEEPYIIIGFDDPVVLHPNLGWENLCNGNLEVISVPGDHDSMVFQPHVKVLGEKLRNCLYSTKIK